MRLSLILEVIKNAAYSKGENRTLKDIWIWYSVEEDIALEAAKKSLDRKNKY